MIISVRVKPGNKRPGIEDAGEYLLVRVKEPPIDGKANTAVLKLIAGALGVAPSRVRLIAGATAKTKRVEIPDIADWRQKLYSAAAK